MGIVVDDTIHFLSHYAKNSKRALTGKQVVAQTLSDVASPLCSTTLILVLGFLIFLVGDFVPNMNLGLMTALTLSFALLLDLVFLPVLLMFKRSGRGPF